MLKFMLKNDSTRKQESKNPRIQENIKIDKYSTEIQEPEA
jgi:hypothetical protein